MVAGVCVVTGGGRGIGRSIVERLRTRKDSLQGIAVLVRTETSKMQIDQLQQDGMVKCQGYLCDVGDSEMVKDTILKVGQELGHINALVNAAGVSKDSLLIRASDSMIEETMRTNLFGSIYVTRAVAKEMLKKKSPGSIVNIGSVVGSCGNAGQTIYSASKAGLAGFSKSLAKELAPRNILVNLIEPGFIQTDMTANLAQTPDLLKTIPLARFGNPEEVSALVEFLLLNKDASYITGQTFRIDGGLSM